MTNPHSQSNQNWRLLVNLLVVLLQGICLWVISGIRDDIREVRSDNNNIRDRVSRIEGWRHEYFNQTGANDDDRNSDDKIKSPRGD